MSGLKRFLSPFTPSRLVDINFPGIHVFSYIERKYFLGMANHVSRFPGRNVGWQFIPIAARPVNLMLISLWKHII